MIIRPDSAARTAENTISEKWDIEAQDSAFTSFEFNRDQHYIAVENDTNRTVHFGEYSMPQIDVIDLENLGTIVINSSDTSGVDFSFFSLDDPETESFLILVFMDIDRVTQEVI